MWKACFAVSWATEKEAVATTEARESPETVSEERSGADVPPEEEKAVSWWRRLFG